MKTEITKSEFEKKIKSRAMLGLIYALIGAAIIITANTIKTDNDVAYSFGAVFAVMGIVRFVQYTRLLNNKSALEKREIAENDERNVMIVTKARSLAFTAYFVLGGITVPVMFLTGNRTIGLYVAYSICAFVVISWLSYLIIRRKY